MILIRLFGILKSILFISFGFLCRSSFSWWFFHFLFFLLYFWFWISYRGCLHWYFLNLLGRHHFSILLFLTTTLSWLSEALSCSLKLHQILSSINSFSSSLAFTRNSRCIRPHFRKHF